MSAADASDADDRSSVGSLRLEEDKEWEDAENDEEQLTFVSLFDGSTFPSLGRMLEHCREKHDFDLVSIIQRFELDFLSAVKLVNYIRSEVKSGTTKLQIASPGIFAEDRYLQPVLEDDAVLYSIDDLTTQAESDLIDIEASRQVQSPGDDGNARLARIAELEEKLRDLTAEYGSYRVQVQETLERRWGDEGPSNSQNPVTASVAEKDVDHSYFDSYSYNEIHELMLKDAVRTDAYRDFIYDNKDIFKDKIVLDIGCGTGILSMFCAKAGASRVIAVDNSAIIDKARANVQKNGLQDVITCVHGKIEQVVLPVESVDIIVSEWMGYCLLFEAMLDSVLWARDRYLRPGGLMVPSHCTLHIAPITDSDYIAENVNFWHNVYGFDMSAMMEKIHDDVLVRHLKPANIIGTPHRFLELPLHDISQPELSFSKSFEVELETSDETLDGWAIWFDTFFLRSPTDRLAQDATATKFAALGHKGVAFTTGPYGKETHWKSGVMLIDEKTRDDERSSTVKGTVEYRKGGSDARALEIDVSWKAGAEIRHQTWYLK